jgi:hypothetical protein
MLAGYMPIVLAVAAATGQIAEGCRPAGLGLGVTAAVGIAADTRRARTTHATMHDWAPSVSFLSNIANVLIPSYFVRYWC